MTWSPYVFESLKLTNHKELYRNALKNLSALVLVVLSTLILFLPEIVHLAAPPEYSSTVNAIVLIMIAFGVQALQQIVMVGFGISKKTYQYSILSILSVAVNILLLLWLVPGWGVFGVGIAFLVGNIFRFAVGLYLSERLYPVGYNLSPLLLHFLVIGLVAVFVSTLDIALILRLIMALIVTSAVVFIHLDELKVIFNKQSTEELK